MNTPDEKHAPVSEVTPESGRGITLLIVAGFACLGISSAFLYVSARLLLDEGGEIRNVILWLTLARIAGICSFCIGIVAMLNLRWKAGAALLFLSVALPLVSLFFHGTV